MEEYIPLLYATFWALIPPLVAIVLALITKEVYSSLFAGVIIGGIFYGIGPGGAFSFETTVLHVFNDGFIASLADAYNMGILIFLVVLGIMVALMNSAGGSAAFGKWASTHIKSKVGAQLVTVLLGCLIFVDDYFNSLTVGSVMRPVTDKYKVSRAKLAYIIDATAAPICIIAPISSWAAAVSGFVEGEDGFSVFIRAIPYNYYAILTLVAMITLILLKIDYGPMLKYEDKVKTKVIRNELLGKDENLENEETKGTVVDLVLPVAVLIISCIIGMIYTGGFFSGANFIQAFSDSDASVGLMVGSTFALIITILWYLLRRVLTFKKCCECIPEGFKAMVPAILILTFAWTLKNMTDSLGAKEFVANLVDQASGALILILPAIIFLVGCFLAFATGTSWGTFGILIPIVVSTFSGVNDTMMIISISACMAGAVCGDHCSPISDTTIMASAGAQCQHLDHVSTQLPYAITVAAVSFVTYIIAGAVQNAAISLAIGIVLMIGTMFGIKYLTKPQQQ